MKVHRHFGSVERIASTEIKTLRKYFDIKGKGNRISLTTEQLKEATKQSVGFSSAVHELQIKYLISQIDLLKDQLHETDKNRRVLNSA